MSTQIASGVTTARIHLDIKCDTIGQQATSYFDNIYFGQPDAPTGLTQLDSTGAEITSMAWTNSTTIVSSFTQSGSVSGSVLSDAVKFHLQVTSGSTDTPDWDTLFIDHTSDLISEGTTGYQWPILTGEATYWWRVWTEDKYGEVVGSTTTVFGNGSEAKFGFTPPKPPFDISGLTQLAGADELAPMEWTNSSVIISSFTLDDPDTDDQLKFYLHITSVTTADAADWSNLYYASTSEYLAEGTTGYQWPALTDRATYWWRVWCEDDGGLVSPSTSSYLSDDSTQTAKFGYLALPNAPSGLTQFDDSGTDIVSMQWSTSTVVISSFTLSSPLPEENLKFYLEITSVTTGGDLADWAQTWHASTSAVIAQGATNYQWPALTDEATYWWRVWSEDSEGYTSSTSTVLETGGDAKLRFTIVPDAPSGLTQISDLGTELVSMQWSSSTVIISSFTQSSSASENLRFYLEITSVTTGGDLADWAQTWYASTSEFITQGTTGYQWPVLTDDATYWWRVWSENSAGFTSSTSTVLGVTGEAKAGYMSAPSAPSNLKVFELIGATTIYWQFDDNATNETELYISSGPDITMRLSENLGPIDGTGTTYWYEVDLITNTAYTRYAESVNGIESSWSAVITSFTASAIPGALTTTTSSYSSIELNWSANDNPGTTRYGVSYSTNSDYATAVSTFVDFASALTDVTTVAYNLSFDTTYYFRLWAYNDDHVQTAYVEHSTTTAPVSTTPGIECTEIMYDTPLMVSDDAGGEWLEFYNNTSGNIDLTGWILKVGTDDTETLSQRAGWGDITAIPPQTFFVISEPASTVDFDTIYGPADDAKYCAVTGTALNLLNTSSELVVLMSAMPGGTTYQYFIYPENADNTSIEKTDFSADETLSASWVPSLVSIGTPFAVGQMPVPVEGTPPAPISDLTALAGSDDGQVVLQWTSPGDDGTVGQIVEGRWDIKYSSVGIITNTNYSSPPDTTYTISIDTTGINPLSPISYLVTGLLGNNELYYFAIKARDEVENNWSVWTSSADDLAVNTSAYMTVQVTPPNNISDLTALAGSNDGEIVLSWTAPGDNLESGNITGGEYWLKYSTNPIGNESGFTSAATFTVTSTNTVTQQPYSTTVTGLNPGTTYYLALKYRDEVAGNWAFWSTGTVATEDINVLSSATAYDAVPPAPSGLTASASSRQLVLSWTAVAVSDLDYYQIYCDSQSASFASQFSSATTTNTTITFSELENNVTYYYRVTSVDKGDHGNGLYSAVLESGYSNEESATPVIAPPSGLLVNNTGTSVMVTWTKSTDDPGTGGCAGYVLSRSSNNINEYYLVVAGTDTLPSGTTYYDDTSVSLTYWYKLKTRDIAGSDSYTLGPSTAVPDTVGPSIDIISPNPADTSLGFIGGNIVIIATITDVSDNAYISGLSTSSVLLKYTDLDGTVYSNTISMAGTDAGSYFRATASIANTAKGTFSYYVEATDNNNNTSTTSTHTVTISVVTSAVVTYDDTGATISVDDGDDTDGSTGLFIPLGAADAGATVTIEQWGYPGAPASKTPPVAFTNGPLSSIAEGSTRPVVCYDFNITGSGKFRKPVIVTMRYLDQNNDGEIDDLPGIFETELGTYWWDNYEWKYSVATVDAVMNTISASVNHFTLFAVFKKGVIPIVPTAKEKFLTPATADGINDSIEFECDTAITQIEIYDVTGKKIRTLDNGSNNWDGTDEDGNIVESGVYIYKVEAANGEDRTGAVVVAK